MPKELTLSSEVWKRPSAPRQTTRLAKVVIEKYQAGIAALIANAAG